MRPGRMLLRSRVRLSVLFLFVPLMLAACGSTQGTAASPLAAVSNQSAPISSPSGAQPAQPSARPSASPSLQPTKAGPGASSQATTIHVATAGALTDAGLYVAADRGYFKQQGLDVQIETLASAANTIPLLATNQIQVGGGSIGVGFFNALQRSSGVKVVADKGLSAPGWPALLFLVRDGLDVKTIQDLRGKKIGLTAQGLAQEINLYRLATQAGMSMKDFNLVLGIQFPDTVQAFANKAIDASIVVEPFGTLAKSKGVAHVWKGTDQISPNEQSAVLLYASEFASKRPDDAKRFAVAYLQGVRDYKSAFNAKTPADKTAVSNALVAHTEVKNPALFDQMAMPYLAADGAVNSESLKADQQTLVDLGYLKQIQDPSTFVDLSFVNYAAGQLGPYHEN